MYKNRLAPAHFCR